MAARKPLWWTVGGRGRVRKAAKAVGARCLTKEEGGGGEGCCGRRKHSSMYKSAGYSVFLLLLFCDKHLGSHSLVVYSRWAGGFAPNPRWVCSLQMGQTID